MDSIAKGIRGSRLNKNLLATNSRLVVFHGTSSGHSLQYVDVHLGHSVTCVVTDVKVSNLPNGSSQNSM